jgi:hypothetical protein
MKALLFLFPLFIPVLVSAQGAATALNNGNNQSQAQQQAGKMPWELLSEQLDFADPGEGVMKWKGKTFDITSSRVFRARFERYLNESYAEQDAEDYRRIMNEIQRLLSIGNGNTNENLDKAFALLFDAAEYDIDGGNSMILANLVYNAWRLRDEVAASRNRVLFLEAQRDQQRLKLRRSTESAEKKFEETEERRARIERQVGRPIRTMGEVRESEAEGREEVAPQNDSTRTITEQGINAREVERDSRDTSRSNSTRQIVRPIEAPGMDGMNETRIDALNLSETEAKILAQRGHAELAGMNARLQYQSQLVQFMAQRRFLHAMIGADFYRHIFKSSGQNLEVGKDRIAEIIPDGDYLPTVDSIASIARSAISDVETGISAVLNARRDRQMISALERLQETFFLGEFLIPVQLLDSEIKREFRSLYQEMREAKNLMDLKDYDGVDEVVRSIASRADDFSAREILAATNTQRTLSNLSLNASRQLASAGDATKAQEKMVQAIEYWPLNPAIQAVTQQAVDLGDARVQARMMFDDSYERNEYRRLYDRSTELAVGLSDDPVRSKQLMEIVRNVGLVDTSIAQAQEMVKRGMPYQAWEFLMAAKEMLPDDGPLNREIANLSLRVAPLVSLLDKAQRTEQQGDYFAALVQYMAADEVAPTRTAREGVERVSAKIMSALDPAPVAAPIPSVEAVVTESASTTPN